MCGYLVELIIFDLMGVTIDFTTDRYIKYLSKKLKLPYKSLYPIFRANMYELNRGKITFKEYKYNLLHRLEKYTKTNIKWGEVEWSKALKSLGKPNKDVQRLVKKLHRRYKVVLLTNINASSYPIATRYLFDKSLFDRRFTSFKLGIGKPDSLIYKTVLKHMLCKSIDTIFIDDKIKNVKGARSVGINGIIFSNYTKLVKDLAKFGVKCV